MRQVRILRVTEPSLLPASLNAHDIRAPLIMKGPEDIPTTSLHIGMYYKEFKLATSDIPLDKQLGVCVCVFKPEIGNVPAWSRSSTAGDA